MLRPDPFLYNAAMHVVLASQSPRRRELLKRLFPAFEVDPSAVDESAIREDDPVLYA